MRGEFLSDFFPVGAMPVELSAGLAAEIIVNPAEGFRRD